jgi:hypothetical protein
MASRTWLLHVLAGARRTAWEQDGHTGTPARERGRQLRSCLGFILTLLIAACGGGGSVATARQLHQPSL